MRKKRKDDYRTTSEKIHDFFEKHLKKMLLFSVPIALAIFGISYFTQNINGMVAILALYPVNKFIGVSTCPARSWRKVLAIYS